MTKTEAKQLAQDQIMHYAGAAFNWLDDNRHEYTQREFRMLNTALGEQFSRAEKLFGITHGTSARGL